MMDDTEPDEDDVIILPSDHGARPNSEGTKYAVPLDPKMYNPEVIERSGPIGG